MPKKREAVERNRFHINLDAHLREGLEKYKARYGHSSIGPFIRQILTAFIENEQQGNSNS